MRPAASELAICKVMDWSANPVRVLLLVPIIK